MPREFPQEAKGLTAACLAVLLLLAASPTAAAATASPTRGAYLAAAAGCDECHTEKAAGRPYAGGRRLASRYGTVVTPNITPDRDTGIGRWSLADFVRAMRWGIAPDDSHYLPVFPFPFYGRLSDADLVDLKAFLDTLRPVSHRIAAGILLPTGRAQAAVAIAAESFPGPWRPEPAKDAQWNRGAYLVATVGRCGDCHTPLTVLGAPDRRRFLGGRLLRGDKKIPDITPDPQTGIGKWSVGDIVALLQTGQTPDFDFVGGAMSEIVRNTARLSDADRTAIAAYLESLPAIPFKSIN